MSFTWETRPDIFDKHATATNCEDSKCCWMSAKIVQRAW